MVLTYYQMVDRCIDGYKRFHLATPLFSIWSQKTSTCGKEHQWLTRLSSRVPAVRLFSNLPQKTSKGDKNNSDTLGNRLVCHFIVVITVWRHLWSITEQTHGNKDSSCYIDLFEGFSSIFKTGNYSTRNYITPLDVILMSMNFLRCMSGQLV